ncbi:sensor histidine kinase [Gorillibacterium massiliense]|uniref:sensor histidine kinase n=1 Tax=Gorillibacterium massiliense TaxID=1280390 RepID=UPI0004B4AE2D|nr:histidine kinase [Gorillibacterium massiliense]
MRFRYHRNRLVFIALLLTLLSEAALIGISYWSTRDIGSEIKRASEQNLTKHVESQIVSKLNEMNSLAVQLESLDFINYARTFLSLRSPEEENEARSDLNSRLEQLHLPPGMVDQIYFIGENVNQMNFGKIISNGEPIPSSEIPWIDELKNAGLLDSFTRYYNMPAYIPVGMLTDILMENRKIIPDDAWLRLNAFAKRIEGHLIINNGVNYLNVLSVIVLDERILSAELPSPSIWDGYVGVLDENRQTLWSNLPNKGALAAAVQRIEGGYSQWEQQIEGNYKARTVSVSPYGLNIVFFERMKNDSPWGQKSMNVYIGFFVCTLLVSFLIAFRLANIIMYPFQMLARYVWKKGNDLDFLRIPEEKFVEGKLSRFSIRGKILFLLLSSVLIPVLLAVGMQGYMMYKDVFNKAIDLSVESSNHLSVELRDRMERYENLTNRLSTDSRFTNLTSPYSYMENMDDFKVASYPGLSDISYFVLYDIGKVARYSSVFYNNLTLFKLSSIDADLLDGLQPEEMIWVSGQEDVYGHPSLMLIKKLSVPSATPGKTTDAYLQVVLKEDAFSYVTSDRKMSFVMLDGSGRFVYSNTSSDGFREAASHQWAVGGEKAEDAVSGKVEGSYQVIVHRQIGINGWSAYMFMTIDDMYVKMNSMFLRFILLIVMIILIILALMWNMLSLLVKPIERLKKAVEKEELLPIKLEQGESPRDEISRLVASFNQMLEQIHELMEENINKQIREKVLITSRMKAELGMLQQQINPHFLYNTLEAINMRARQYGATEVSTMVNSLAKIFRFTINTGGEVVPLAEEIEHARNYLTIQELRFQSKFTVRWQLDESAMRIPVLKFILQPIIENALQHGIEDLHENGDITITAEAADNRLILSVADNGIGMSGEELAKIKESFRMDTEPLPTPVKGIVKRSSGVGLINVYQRLRLYYGDPLELRIDSEEFKGTTVTLCLPIQPVVAADT